MRRCWLFLTVLLLCACSATTPTPTNNAIATQTRLAELGQLTQVAATQTRATELTQLTQVAGTVAALSTAVAAQPPTPVSTPRLAGNPPSPTSPAGPPPARTAAGPTPTSARSGPRPTATKPGLPTFADMVLDEKRGRLYGSDNAGGHVEALALPSLEVVGIVDVGQAAQPAGLALSPDGAELAVALSGAGHIVLIDPEHLSVTGKLYPKVENGPNMPWDVRYSQPGRLYSVGNPGSAGIDYIHVFDTAAHTEIGISKYPEMASGRPRLALTADGTLFVGESAFSPQQIYRFSFDGNTPKRVAQGPHGPVIVPDLAVRADGSAVYTAGGQVWSGNLQSQLGAFTAKGTRIEYVPATERLFVCQEAAVAEVEAQGNYNVVASHPVSAMPRVARANAAGTILYVSTDAGLDVIPLTPGAKP